MIKNGVFKALAHEGAMFSEVKLPGDGGIRHVAKFVNRRRYITFSVDSDNVSALAVPLYYDSADQSDKYAFFYTIKSALSFVCRGEA